MIDRQVDIHKAGAILLRDKKLLLTHELGKKFYLAPGGIVETGETSEEAVIRELEEEVNIKVTPANLDFFGTFYAQAAGAEDKYLQMDVYLVKNWSGEPTPSSIEEEIDAIAWVNTLTKPDNIQIGSIFEHQVMPTLKKLGLID
jgi:mutator protein MutT